MRAIVIQHFGGLDSLVIKNLPDPIAQPGSVLIEVKRKSASLVRNSERRGRRENEWWFASELLNIQLRLT